MEPRTIAVIGGGRWGRVHIVVLSNLLGPGDSILWLSKHGYEANKLWLRNKGLTSVSLFQKEQSLFDQAPDALIIATASHSHAAYVEKALTFRIPVLSEKPFALDIKTAEHLYRLAQQVHIPVGMNLEYLEACYLHRFKSLLQETFNNEVLRDIEIEWQDPIFEMRHGELKIGDYGTPIAYDQGIHCWSLMKILLENLFPLEVESVVDKPEGLVTVLAHCRSTQIRLLMNRRSSKRVRRITVNQGKAVLDFSQEPGWIQLGINRLENTWTGHRPLKAALLRFLEQVSYSSDIWPCAIQNTLPATYFCNAIHQKLTQSMLQRLEKFKQMNSIHIDHPELQWLLIDLNAPQWAAQGYRIALYPESERIKLLRQALDQFGTSRI